MSCPLLPLEATWDTSVHAARHALRLKLPAVFDILGQLLFFPLPIPEAFSENLQNLNASFIQWGLKKNNFWLTSGLTWGVY